MKVLLVLAVALAAVSAMRIPEEKVKAQFEDFKVTYGKKYASEAEELHRSKIFKENLIRINEHNERFKRGEVSFTVRVNHLADMHTHEVVEAMNGFRPELKKASSRVHTAPAQGWQKSKKVDWRDSGLVSEVKDQGTCGSCWSFSATGALEGQLAKKTGKMVSLSEQNLVDCTTGSKYQNEGCNGGLMDAAFQYIVDNKGIDTEKSYPYTGLDGRCQYKKKNVGGTATGYVDVEATEEALQHAVETVGPIAVAIDASNWSFQYYDSGVYNEESCSSTSLDHGVLAVGFGTDKSHTWWGGSTKTDYWLVKNSWGSSWGINGYIKMARNKDNRCGIATMASYPTV